MLMEEFYAWGFLYIYDGVLEMIFLENIWVENISNLFEKMIDKYG